jgi:hypothetical protein
VPLTLEQYALDYLPGRGLPWPAAPKIDAPKARPHLSALNVRVIFWNLYGTLLAVPHGELRYEHDQEFVTDAVLDKVLKEFNFWNSMARKPGPPASHLKEMVNKALTLLRMTGSGGEKHPEILAERVWEEVLKKLKSDYKYDMSLFGPPAEYAKRIAYFYHASIQGFGAYDGAADALKLVMDRGGFNGLLADAQCFTTVQLFKACREQDPSFELNAVFPLGLRVLSFEKKARKPSETLFRAAIEALAARGLKPADAAVVGSNIARDLQPAKKLGFRTVLFAGDKGSLAATPEQLKDAGTKPDGMMTALPQIVDCLR